MKKIMAQSFLKTPGSWWILLGLTVLLWLLVCAWVLKTLGFWGAQNFLDVYGFSLTTEPQISSSESMLQIETDVPRLKLLKQGATVAETSALPSDSAVTGLAAAEVAAVKKPVVITVDVSSFTDLDRAEELVLYNQANRQTSAPQSELVREQEDLRLKAERLTVDESVDKDALSESDAASSLTGYERLREIELSVLDQLSSQIRFDLNSANINQGLERVLDRMFDPLYLYSDTRVIVRVATIESTSAATNNLLSRDRGQAIVAYWVNRGLAFDRFSIFIEPGDGLPFGTHRVKVLSEEISR